MCEEFHTGMGRHDQTGIDPVASQRVAYLDLSVNWIEWSLGLLGLISLLLSPGDLLEPATPCQYPGYIQCPFSRESRKVTDQ